MTDWFDDLNGVTQTAGGKAPAAPQQRDWFSDINGASPQKSAKASPAPAEQGWVDWAADLPKRAVAAARGTQDPAFKDVPAFDARPEGNSGRLWGGALMGADDAAHGDQISKVLGDKFIRRFKDANGYDIIEHRGDDGKPTQSYVNKPGLDLADVTRGVVGAVPYIAGGLGIGAATKGASLVMGAAAQGMGAGATSLATDVGNMALGSEQTPDVGKAALTTAMGTGATLVAPAVGALWRRFVTIPGMVDSSGNLTAKGAEAARRAGVDPAQMQGTAAKEFAATYAKTGDEAAAAIQGQSKAYGVETSLGQRTKDPQQLLREKNMRMGIYGENAKSVMSEFDRRQADQLEQMVRGTGVAAPSSKMGPPEPSMIDKLSPGRTFRSTNPDVLGEDIKSGIQSARGAAKAGEKAAWSDVPDLVPKQEAFSDLAPLVTNKLGGQRLSTSTPQAMKMDEALADYASGKVVASGTKLVNQSPIQTVDDMRRHLKDIMTSADPNHKADVAAATKIYDGFNEWVAQSAQKSLLNGDVANAANLTIARDVTKQMHQVFKPTGDGFKPNAATRIMGNVLETEATPERIISSLFSNPTKSTTKDGAVQALNAIKTGLFKYTPADAAETWNAIRVAHWSKLVQGNDGRLLSPTVMAKNIESAVSSHGTLINTLYTSTEKMQMMKVLQVLKSVSWKDPNPSGTATALGGMAREFFGTLMKALPTPLKVGLEFSKLPQAVGTVGAKNAVSQSVRTTTNPQLGGFAAAGANALYGQ